MKDDEKHGGEQSDASEEPARLALTPDQLAEFSGTFFSAELDATYRFAVDHGRLVVRIEQELPLAVTPVTDDHFMINFDEQAYSGVLTASLAFNRDGVGAISGFGLSSETERGILFEKR